MKTQTKLLFFLAFLLAGLGANAQCSSNFSVNMAGAGLVVFNDSLPGQVSCNWDFGDGNTSSDSSFSVSHTYTASGTYIVCLTTVYHPSNCTSTTCDTLVINLCQGISNFTASQTASNFYSFNAYNLHNLSGATAYWTFGDGTNSSSASPTHQYASSGNYQVCLKVTGTGCIDSTCNNITASSVTCTNSFTYFVQPGGSVLFFDSSNYNQSCHWNFGDSTSSNDSSYSFTHQYTTSGAFNVCFTTTDRGTGCTATSCSTVVVNLCQGASNFGITQTGFGSYSFNAYNFSSIPGASAHWRFGDGIDTLPFANVAHHYAANGNYQVCVTVTGTGCVDSSCVNLGVTLCNYANGFNYDTVGLGPIRTFTVAQPNAAAFYPGYSYSWNFGDGYGASGDTATHSFNTSNYFQVCLITSDAVTGCRDSSCQTQYFDRCGNGQPYITYNTNGLDASFSAYVSPPTGTYTYLWSFPGANPSSAGTQSATTVYNQLGNQQATVIVTSSGCSDTVTQSFTLTPPAYSISGSISKNGAPACATIYLIRQDTAGHLVLIDSLTSLDTLGSCTGQYSFTGLPVDTYYVKAALEAIDVDYANYLPTYYGNVLQWSSATAIPLLTFPATGININLVAGNNTGGPGFVGGWVSQGAGLVINEHNNGSRSVGDPIAGAQINLLTSTGQAVAYTYTDVNGYYHFSNLALGSYDIYAEALNKRAVPIPFTLTAANPADSTVSLSINSSTVTDINELNSISVNRIYPNPATSFLNLEIGSNMAADASLKLNDMLGKAVVESKIKLTSGTNALQLDMSELAAGIYQLMIQTNSRNIAFKVVKAK